MIRDEFANWLLKQNLRGASINYPPAINLLSDHYSAQTGTNTDIYAIRDSSKLKSIVEKYGQKGIYSEQGYHHHGRYRAAIRSYQKFFEDKFKPTLNDPPIADDATLAEAQRMIAALREKGKRAVAQRDEWEARANKLEKELADARRIKQDWKFQEAKRCFAKLYHPNSPEYRPLEKMIRSEIFKEFWGKFERIESQESP